MATCVTKATWQPLPHWRGHFSLLVVVEHPLRKRKVVGSIPTCGYYFGFARHLAILHPKNNDSGMEKGRASSPRDFAVILNCNHARDDTPTTQALKILPTDYQMVLDRGTKRSMIRQNRGSARSLLTNMSTHTGEPSHTRQRTIPSPPFLRSSALQEK